MVKLKSFLDAIVLEPVLFLFMVLCFMRMPVIDSLFYQKGCIQLFEKHGNYSINCSDVYKLHNNDLLHAYYNHLKVAWNLSTQMSSFLTTILLGLAADKWRYKVPLLIPLFGMLVSNASYILQVFNMSWSPYYLLIGDTVFGLCGSFISLVALIFSYSMRKTREEYRDQRLMALEVSCGAGAAIGTLLSENVHSRFGYPAVFVSTSALNLLAILYVVFIIDDIASSSASLENDLILKLKQSFVDCWSLSSHNFKSRYLLILTLFCISVEYFLYAGFNDILYSFLYKRFNFIDKQYGYLNFANLTISTFVIIFAYFFWRKRNADQSVNITIFCSLNRFAFFFILAFAYQKYKWLIYVALVPWSFERLNFTAIRSIVSQLVSDNEQARAFSLIGFLQTFMTILATLVYNYLFPLTLSFFDGTMFVLSAFLTFIPLAIFIYIRLNIKKALTNEDDENPIMNYDSDLFE